MSWSFSSATSGNWTFSVTLPDIYKVNFKLFGGAYRADRNDVYERKLWSIGPGRWDRVCMLLHRTGELEFVSRSDAGGDGVLNPDTTIVLPEVSARALWNYISRIPLVAGRDEMYDFDDDEDSNGNDGDPNQLTATTFDYEAAMRAIGLRGAAEVAVLRGTAGPAAAAAGAGAGAAGPEPPRRFPGLGKLIGEYVGGRRGRRKSRKAQKRGRNSRRQRR